MNTDKVRAPFALYEDEVEGIDVMADETFPEQRCAAILAALNEEMAWRLDVFTQRHYIWRITEIISVNDQTDAELRMIMVRYHLDHDMVTSLCDPHHPLHQEHWHAWWPQVMRILQQNRLIWSNDSAVDSEDLAQIAWAELARSLPSFQYNSRFSTWAYQVIVRSVQRAIRNGYAQKRAGRPSSIDQHPDLYLPISDQDLPESQAALTSLRDLACAILSNHRDGRLHTMFTLWQEEDASVAQLGAIFNLSAPRVRSLLTTICNLLRDHPAIRTWLDDESFSPIMPSDVH
jgi:RNA polymerase sigma factor (sigma-70 family)